jgi:hypothetical protein
LASAFTAVSGRPHADRAERWRQYAPTASNAACAGRVPRQRPTSSRASLAVLPAPKPKRHFARFAGRQLDADAKRGARVERGAEPAAEAARRARRRRARAAAPKKSLRSPRTRCAPLSRSPLLARHDVDVEERRAPAKSVW